MWIITNFGQFVLFCVEFDMCKVLIDFIVWLLMVEVSVRHCPIRHCPVLQCPPLRSRPSMSSPAISVNPYWPLDRWVCYTENKDECELAKLGAFHSSHYSNYYSISMAVNNSGASHVLTVLFHYWCYPLLTVSVFEMARCPSICLSHWLVAAAACSCFIGQPHAADIDW